MPFWFVFAAAFLLSCDSFCFCSVDLYFSFNVKEKWLYVPEVLANGCINSFFELAEEIYK